MSEREWFVGGVSRFVRDIMLLFIGLDVLGIVVRRLATSPYEGYLAGIFLWLVIYGVAYLFRRRAP